jgi:hypothetical protein
VQFSKEEGQRYGNRDPIVGWSMVVVETTRLNHNHDDKYFVSRHILLSRKYY